MIAVRAVYGRRPPVTGGHCGGRRHSVSQVPDAKEAAAGRQGPRRRRAVDALPGRLYAARADWTGGVDQRRQGGRRQGGRERILGIGKVGRH